MSSGQNASTSPGVPDAPRRRSRIPDPWTMCVWSAVAIATFLLVAAVIERLGSDTGVDLRWVAMRASEAGRRDVAGSEPSAAVRAFYESAILPGTSANLDDIGALLDDPNLGREKRDNRPASADEVIPIKKRWKVQLAAGLTEGKYARQLAALGIELGVLGNDGNIEYAAHVGGAKVERRTGPAAQEKRLYWTWQRGDLIRADRILLANQGLEVTDQIVLHICPQETVDKLSALELAYRNRKPEDIQLTRFSVKQTFRGYQVYVLEQIPR